MTRTLHGRLRRGQTIIEPIVALALLAIGALGSAALLAHALHRLARVAQLAHTRDAALAATMRAAAQPCGATDRGVQALAIVWTDSLSGQVTARAAGAPCAQ
ncbi:MAG: hypothetical protein HY275_00670 [Gemmatimonadetes bacterium]|nr:hypothetical protein [Gemmatimonadota bacterium]